ncbi:phage tail protein [Paraburkholderia bannensis]|uniref:phage tail protein n=1 Tax=Paraburkholderia bannensis TaxID=765414 RepID=UPI002AC32CD7|nr:phage tail protein [Paraburkholderia bannensis]
MITNFRDVPAEVWRERIAQANNRASGAIFYWCVSTAEASVEPRVVVAQFGDGYAQRRAAGINTQDQVWALNLYNRRQALADEVLDFLTERNGVDVFNWSPPRTSKTLNVICPEWSWSYGDMLPGGERVINIAATFQEVHA